MFTTKFRMTDIARFQDKNLLLTHFYKAILVVCPSCEKKANAVVNFEDKIARLFCANCGYNKETKTVLSAFASVEMAANKYFDAQLWLSTNFKNEIFWAYNYEHLDYLEQYISAFLREHNDRSQFTLLEKLPKFYHEAKNRVGLLKTISKLKNK